MKSYRYALFDMDGVIVDTAKYHYEAWRRLAEGLGFEFTMADNERLKGVSRMRSLEILLEVGNVKNLPSDRLEELCRMKNSWYIDYISKVDKREILKGTVETLTLLRRNGIKIALATASKNSQIILERLELKDLFDAIIDGNLVERPKPDPEVFLKAAEALGGNPDECVVFEDAYAGIEAAKKAGMYAVGIGDNSNLIGADMVIPGLCETDQILQLFN
ncbi:beta-phosphoglucomutase [Alkaliphilus serpentinus]|uniref:Beta-phosphoglucomutase n=1 Tax=Alkaliphilus serpentinus TaxID=1482731 RepID=A0A833HLM1_9FIRM|nr:beta-phosphoglucomutase [Alkaliphilus serpentinus]KAB3526228.1 beta-phosphoglucomutase [Alkaliphilus serpentinus]